MRLSLPSAPIVSGLCAALVTVINLGLTAAQAANKELRGGAGDAQFVVVEGVE